MPNLWSHLREDVVLDNGRYWTRLWEKVACFGEQSTRSLGQYCGENVAGICREWTSYFPCNDSIVQGYSQKQGRGKLSIHFAADQDTIDTIYRIILSVNQLSVYRAVAATCEEFEDHQDRTGELVILMGQSIVLGEVEAETPLQNESPMNDQIDWQQYIQQVDSLSPENRVSKFCKEAGFMRVVEAGQYFVTNDTETISLSGLLRIHPSTRRSSFSTQRVDSRKYENWACIGSHNQFSKLQIWDWNSNWVRESRRFSFLGQNFLWNDQKCGRFNSRQHRNSLQIHKKSKFHKQARVWLQPGQRHNQSHNRGYSLVRQQPHAYMKEDGLTLNHQNKILLRTISRRKWSIFFDTVKRYSEKKMEQLILQIIIHKNIIGLMIVGNLVWLQEEVRKGDISISLIIREQVFTSVLFKVILEAISLILRYRTMYWLELEYLHLSRWMHVQSSFYYQQWIGIWRSKFEQKTNSVLFACWSNQVSETLNILTSLYHVERDTCTVHGRCIKTRYFGSILTLESKKD